MGPTHVLYFSPPAETKQPQHHNQPQRKQKVSIEGEEEGSEHDSRRRSHHCGQKIKWDRHMYYTFHPQPKQNSHNTTINHNGSRR
mmetsp:Transcript_15837/g.31654  ORF Transcript_15837/g.31654 Transcript_15837/m.31654 type:complete len:85 (+) Transcript_15837:91-345(+)